MHRVLLVTLLAGCPYVPPGEIRGDVEVVVGETTSLRLWCCPLFGDWERVPCGRDWQVQGTTGGDDVYGTVDDCGNYTAPLVAPPEAPEVLATECDFGGGCADACGAVTTITLVSP